jgi:hypothetical protein
MVESNLVLVGYLMENNFLLESEPVEREKERDSKSKEHVYSDFFSNSRYSTKSIESDE